MEQPDLFTRPPGHGRALARKSDHDSSHMAADAHERSGRRAKHAQVALDLVCRYPGLSVRALMAECPALDNVELTRRLADLADDGLVERIKVPGERIRWVPTRDGFAAWRKNRGDHD